jgi:hypothetical protein
MYIYIFSKIMAEMMINKATLGFFKRVEQYHT